MLSTTPVASCLTVTENLDSIAPFCHMVICLTDSHCQHLGSKIRALYQPAEGLFYSWEDIYLFLEKTIIVYAGWLPNIIVLILKFWAEDQPSNQNLSL